MRSPRGVHRATAETSFQTGVYTLQTNRADFNQYSTDSTFPIKCKCLGLSANHICKNTRLQSELNMQNIDMLWNVDCCTYGNHFCIKYIQHIVV